jgi:hypothetical protein
MYTAASSGKSDAATSLRKFTRWRVLSLLRERNIRAPSAPCSRSQPSLPTPCRGRDACLRVMRATSLNTAKRRDERVVWGVCGWGSYETTLLPSTSSLIATGEEWRHRATTPRASTPQQRRFGQIGTGPKSQPPNHLASSDSAQLFRSHVCRVARSRHAVRYSCLDAWRVLLLDAGLPPRPAPSTELRGAACGAGRLPGAPAALVPESEAAHPQQRDARPRYGEQHAARDVGRFERAC